jgi:hypothetical protein
MTSVMQMITCAGSTTAELLAFLIQEIFLADGKLHLPSGLLFVLLRLLCFGE